MEAGQETLFHHILMILIAIIGEGLDGDAAAGVEKADNLQVFGIHQLDQVLHDDVHTILMEVAMVAEAKEIKLEALAFHHQRTRDIINDNMSKIGLTCLGAQRSKLGTVERHQVIIFRVLVLEGLQHFRRIVVTVLGVLVSQQSYTF